MLRLQAVEKHDDEDEDENDEDGWREARPAHAVAFTDGRWWLVSCGGLVADHLGRSAWRIEPPPRALAFDQSGHRLACVVGEEVVVLHLAARVVLSRFGLPAEA